MVKQVHLNAKYCKYNLKKKKKEEDGPSYWRSNHSNCPSNSHLKHCWDNVWLWSHRTNWSAPSRWVRQAPSAMKQCLVGACWTSTLTSFSTCVWTLGLQWDSWTIAWHLFFFLFLFFSSTEKHDFTDWLALLCSVSLWPPSHALLLSDLWSRWGP